MELTINNLIKIVLGVLVFTIIVLGVYFYFSEYVSPYFSGFHFNSTSNVNIGGSEDICKGKQVIGRIDLYDHSWAKSEKNYLFIGTTPTFIFVDETGLLKWDDTFRNNEVGRINGAQIEIYVGISSDYSTAKTFDGAYLGGREICK
jgi:hypothetical protein